MHSYIITGIRMGPFAKLLREHGFTPTPRNLGRLVFILQNCAWSSLFAWREKAIYRHKMEKFPIPDNPIIIIGHWRTGSTFLHYLLARDPQLITPSLFQVTVPEGSLVSANYYRPILNRVLKHRPMDRVEIGFEDPQEDEFALLKLTGESPLLKIIFPEHNEYFLKDAAGCNPPAGDIRERWKQQFLTFGRKIIRDTGKTLLLKNPVHSLRIPLLLETFPNARFIHIHRHPYKVVASSLNLWKVMAQDNQLKGKPYYPSLEEVTEGLNLFYNVIENDLAELPAGRFCEVGYEALEKDPLGEIRKIYACLNLEFSPEHEQKIRSYLEKARQFTKNSYTFGEEDKQFVAQRLKRHFERYQYPA